MVRPGSGRFGVGFWVGFWVGLRARDFPTERVLSRTPLIIRTVDQKAGRRHAARIDADAYPGSTGTTRVVGGGDYARDVLWLRFPSDLRMPIVPLARVEAVLVLLKALGS